MFRSEDDPAHEMPVIDFVFDEIRRARVWHRCSACSHRIQPGQRYRHIFTKVDFELQVQKFHGESVGYDCPGQRGDEAYEAR
jgi:hypothetical protein